LLLLGFYYLYVIFPYVRQFWCINKSCWVTNFSSSIPLFFYFLLQLLVFLPILSLLFLSFLSLLLLKSHFFNITFQATLVCLGFLYFFKLDGRSIVELFFKKKNWCRQNFQSRDRWQKNQAMIFKNIYDDEEEIVLGGKPRKGRNILQMMIELPWRQTQIGNSITTTSTFCDFVKT